MPGAQDGENTSAARESGAGVFSRPYQEWYFLSGGERERWTRGQAWVDQSGIAIELHFVLRPVRVEDILVGASMGGVVPHDWPPYLTDACLVLDAKSVARSGSRSGSEARRGSGLQPDEGAYLARSACFLVDQCAVLVARFAHDLYLPAELAHVGVRGQ